MQQERLGIQTFARLLCSALIVEPQDVASGLPIQGLVWEMYRIGLVPALGCRPPGQCGLLVAPPASIRCAWAMAAQPLPSPSEGGIKEHASCLILFHEKHGKTSSKQCFFCTGIRQLVCHDGRSGLHVGTTLNVTTSPCQTGRSTTHPRPTMPCG
eukprot:364744-Chlamydomonas_euryale.AAC.6